MKISNSLNSILSKKNTKSKNQNDLGYGIKKRLLEKYMSKEGVINIETVLSRKDQKSVV
tara:strand:+ start:57 stop:233 length:177 start_codon:yes stop_codon:yes gene_type:complete